MSGKVVDERGEVVNDALLSSTTIVQPIPYTDTKYDTQTVRNDGGFFTVGACNVGDLEIQAFDRKFGMSEAMVASKCVKPGMDWLGRKTYRVRDVVLVLRAKKAASTTGAGLK